MFLKKTPFASLAAVLLIGLLVVSCDQPTGLGSINAQRPTITGQPQSGTWDVSEDDVFTLTVTANSTDGGTLSYQWYERNAKIGGDNATLTLAKANYLYNRAYYFRVVVTNTIADNRDGGTKTASISSSIATVTVTGGLAANNPVIAGLIGEWEEEYATYTITSTTFSTGSDYGGYGGTIVNHRGDGANAGYITIQYTSNDNAPEAVGSYYVIHYENLTASTMDISSAFDSDDYTENGFVGKATQEEAERAYTTGNGCFSQHDTITRVIDSNLVNAEQPDITGQPTGGLWNIWLPFSHTINIANLTVTADSPDGGDLSYQWYVNSANSESGSTLLTGKTNATLSLTAAEIASTYTTINNGTNYFYVVVTNMISDNNDGGTKTATTRSNIVNVTVDGVANGIIGKWTADFGDWFEITSGFHFSASDYTGEDVFFAGAIQYVSFFTSEFGIIIIKYDEGKEIVWWSGDERTGDYYGIYIDNIKPGVSMAISQTSDQNNSYGPTETATLDEAITRFDADGGGVWFFEGMTPDYLLE